MVKKSFILKLFRAFSHQRWNDHIRFVPLVEMDKNAHKMFIAYCLAKYEEAIKEKVDWHKIINGGIFELLKRCILSDIKSPIYRQIRVEYKETSAELNKWVFKQLKSDFTRKNFYKEFREYLDDGEKYLGAKEKNILDAASNYATLWEFNEVIKRAYNPENDNIKEVAEKLISDLEPFKDKLAGPSEIESKTGNIKKFINKVGELRYQVRWGQTPRLPLTTVLGHSMMVAVLSYLLTCELPEPCPERIRNNFFGGLFHDLGECVTRDIISPVKGAVPSLKKILGKIEGQLLQKDIYPLVEKNWLKEFKYYTQEEFNSKIQVDGRTKHVKTKEINKKYNKSEFNPIDGELIKAADSVSAFVEAFKSIQAGVTSPDLEEGFYRLKFDYEENDEKAFIGGINVRSIFADFSD